MGKHVARGGYSTIDKFVGARIRERRLMLGLSQRYLADSVGLMSQQMVLKYELGKNAVSASRLYEIASALSTTIEYFFDGFGSDETLPRRAHQPLLLSLMRSLSEIENEVQLEAVGQLVRALATTPAQGQSLALTSLTVAGRQPFPEPSQEVESSVGAVALSCRSSGGRCRNETVQPPAD